MKAKLIPIALNLAVAALCLPQASQAQKPTLLSEQQQGGGADWTAAIWQTPTLPLVYYPSVNVLSGPLATAGPGANYELAYNGNTSGCGTGDSRLYGPYGASQFPGDSLQIDANCGLMLRDSADFPGVGGSPGLILNGGFLNGSQSDLGNGVSVPILGNIYVASPSFVATGNGQEDCGMDGNHSVSFGGVVSGPSDAVIEIINTGGPPAPVTTVAGVVGGTTYAPPVQVTNGLNTFTGTWIVQCGWLQTVNPGSIDNGSTGSANILVDPKDKTYLTVMPNAGTPVTQGDGSDGNMALFEPMYNVNSAGTLTLNQGGVMALHQFCAFASVTIGGTSLANGTYTYAELASAFPAYFLAGGYGAITVEPYNPNFSPPSVYITTDTQPVSVYAYQAATISVAAAGTGPLTYRWYSNSPPSGTYYLIPGAAAPSYSLTGPQTAALAGQGTASPQTWTAN